MEKFFREIKVGKALVLLSGIIVMEGSHGEEFHQTCRECWVPWENNGRIIKALNSVTIEGDPGQGIDIRVFESSLRERRILSEIRPGFSKKKITEWRYEVPITVVIKGVAKTETWTVSHWRLFSGKIVFDFAKNGIQIELPAPTPTPKPTTPTIDPELAGKIASEQVGVSRLPKNDWQTSGHAKGRKNGGNGRHRQKEAMQ